MPWWKPGVSATLARKARTAAAHREERRQKALVRARDKVCRFPCCGCGPLNYALHVAHLRHKGIGGDVHSIRSQADGMILLCSWRHLFGRFAVDKGNLRWEALTPFGARGRVLWQIKDADGVWVDLAAEVAPHVLEALTVGQRHTLDTLARMER